MLITMRTFAGVDPKNKYVFASTIHFEKNKFDVPVDCRQAMLDVKMLVQLTDPTLLGVK